MQILNDLFDDVVVVILYTKFLRPERVLSFIVGGAFICEIILLCRFLGIASVVTGAIHMFYISGAQDFYKKNIFTVFLAESLSDLRHKLVYFFRQFRQVTSHIAVNNPIIVRSSFLKLKIKILPTLMKTVR